ncbi:MAG TPA: diacylglycerol kinase family protein, partial [Acidimicrobiia bacterium]|nr:diacylglycerol kinase family protein [Acidimicrobiia bacterium]
MRVLLIVNPTASSVTPRAQAAIADALGVRHDLEVALTSSRNHASELARNAVATHADVVVVLAGDGTLNEAAQGLVGSDTALAPLPGGSTNVFARTLGVAYDPLSACAQLLHTLDAGTPTRVGVGVARADEKERRFLFHLGVGFDAAAVREMEERHTHLKRRLAHPAFALATADAWLRGYDRTTEITATAAGRDDEGERIAR